MSDWIFELETEYHRARWVYQGWGNGYVWRSDLNEIKPYFWQVDVEYDGNQDMAHGYADTPELAMQAAQAELSSMTETTNDYYAVATLEAAPACSYSRKATRRRNMARKRDMSLYSRHAILPERGRRPHKAPSVRAEELREIAHQRGLEAAPDPQASFPGWQTLVNCSRQALGVVGERVAATALARAGWQVTTLTHGGTDLRAKNPETGELVKVEVKTSRRGNDRKWRFNLQSARTSHKKSDVVMLQQILDSGAIYTYLIPSQELGNRKQLTLPSPDYKGKWAAYRQAATLNLATVL